MSLTLFSLISADDGDTASCSAPPAAAFARYTFQLTEHTRDSPPVTIARRPPFSKARYRRTHRYLMNASSSLRLIYFNTSLPHSLLSASPSLSSRAHIRGLHDVSRADMMRISARYIVDDEALPSQFARPARSRGMGKAMIFAFSLGPFIYIRDAAG